MIQLDKEIVIENTSGQKSKKEIPIDEVSLFSKKVLQRMQKDNIVPTPYNFQIYFESMLEKADIGFKDSVDSIRQDENQHSNGEHVMEIEKEMKEGYSSIKSMIQSIGGTYKNIALLRNHIKKTDVQLSTTTNKSTTTNILETLRSDIDKFDNAIESQLKNLKALSHYEKQALLAIHTGNVSYNSFVAEIKFHSDALVDWKATLPVIGSEWYERAITAKMSLWIPSK